MDLIVRHDPVGNFGWAVDLGSSLLRGAGCFENQANRAVVPGKSTGELFPVQAVGLQPLH